MKKKRLRGDRSALCRSLRRGSGEGSVSLCSLATDDRDTWDNTKLCQQRFRLDIRKIFFTVMVLKLRNRLPREVVGAPWLSVFKMHLDNAFNNIL